jgi:regulator of protease activity HflC (stomatin/prohibitin superfamily)
VTAILIVVIVLAVIALTAAGAAVRVLREYERAVVFRLGRLMDQRGPGLVLLVPTIDRMVRVSLRTVTLTVPPQETITRDNIPVRVTAVAYYRVVDANMAITQVESFHNATLQIAQTTLRSVLGGVDLDSLLAERERLNESLQRVIDQQTEPWGIKVTTVEIRDVEIPERMQHAIARQAEAERERRAKIINAEGEFQAAAKLADAAEVIGRNPTTLQLRYLQTLREIGATQSSTIVFPIDLVKPVVDAVRGAAAAGADDAAGDHAGAGGELTARSVGELGVGAPGELGVVPPGELGVGAPGELGVGAPGELGVGAAGEPGPAAERGEPPAGELWSASESGVPATGEPGAGNEGDPTTDASDDSTAAGAAGQRVERPD